MFPQVETLTSAKILGIFFSFQNEDLEKNRDDLICSIPHTTVSSLNLNNSLFSKVISFNQHLLPKILFLSRVIPANIKQTKTLTSHLFKFLWNSSSSEPIKRSTFYLPKTDGGIFLSSSFILDGGILYKCKNAFCFLVASYLSFQTRIPNISHF